MAKILPMCLAIPAQVVSLSSDRPDTATVEVSGVRRAVHIGLLDTGVDPGDWVLVHVGFAMTKIDEAEARSVLEMLRAVAGAYEEELAALAEGPGG